MTITANLFNELLQQDKPVVVDFGATWCGPCKKMSPIIDALAADYEGKAIIGKADVEEEEELALQLGIRSVPTILFFKNGVEVDKQVGAVSRQVLEDKLKAIL